LGRPISEGIGLLSFFSSVLSFSTGFSFGSAGFFSQFLVLPIGFSELSKI
jgi:hypothetical protein